MESKRLRLTPGMARVEFLAVKDEVESLLARGYLLKPAYAQLTKENRRTKFDPYKDAQHQNNRRKNYEPQEGQCKVKKPFEKMPVHNINRFYLLPIISS